MSVPPLKQSGADQERIALQLATQIQVERVLMKTVTNCVAGVTSRELSLELADNFATLRATTVLSSQSSHAVFTVGCCIPLGCKRCVLFRLLEGLSFHVLDSSHDEADASRLFWGQRLAQWAVEIQLRGV